MALLLFKRTYLATKILMIVKSQLPLHGTTTKIIYILYILKGTAFINIFKKFVP